MMPAALLQTLIEVAPERMKPCATIEEDMALMAKAGGSDRALGAAMLAMLEAA